MTFEQVFTYVTLGVTLAHKLVDVAKWCAAQTKSTEDDGWVAKAESGLAALSNALGFVPALRQAVRK